MSSIQGGVFVFETNTTFESFVYNRMQGLFLSTGSSGPEIKVKKHATLGTFGYFKREQHETRCMKWLHENFTGLDRGGELLGFMNYFIVQCSFIYISFQLRKNNPELLNSMQNAKKGGLGDIERHVEQGHGG